MTPYTYFLEWKDLGLKYYGCRYSRNCDPSDLFRTYFTSSKHVKKLLNEGKTPDTIRIHKTFKTKEEAVEYERKFLDRVGAVNSKSWLNRSNGDLKFSNDAAWNKSKSGIYSEETKRKIGLASAQRRHTEETKQRISSSAMGLKRSETTKLKMRKSKSPEHRLRISQALKEYKRTEQHQQKINEARWGVK